MALRRINLDERTFDISYKIIDNNKDSWLLVLHGWGANKELMEGAFGKCFKEYNHLYIDLPGFGNSTNSYVLDSMGYAMVLRRFLEVMKLEVNAVMGHSFGGKVALLLNPRLLILLSSAGLLKQKSLKVRLKIKLAKVLKTLGLNLSFLRSKDANNLSPNMYETFKLVVDEDFSSLFGEFSNKAIIFWGREDDATPLFLGERMHALLRDSSFHVCPGGHFFFLEHANNIDRIVNG